MTVQQFDVYDQAGKFLGKAPVAMWNDTPARYIVFNDQICEISKDGTRYVEAKAAPVGGIGQFHDDMVLECQIVDEKGPRQIADEKASEGGKA